MIATKTTSMAKGTESEAKVPENGVNQEAPTLSQSDIGQSPILTVIRKRLRAANKRLKRIEDIEGNRAAGKTLDADQVNMPAPSAAMCLPALMTRERALMLFSRSSSSQVHLHEVTSAMETWH